MKTVCAVLFISLFFCPSAVSGAEKTVRLTPLEVVLAARKMIDENRTDAARILLTRAEFAPSEIEMERRYLLGVLAVKTGRIDEAILIYRDLLNKNPRLAKIRIELALAYMARKSWYLADYHLRLAAAEKLPPGIDEKIGYLRAVVRRNKNWNIWFSAGIAPDNNVNNSQTGTQCIQTSFGIFCNTLEDPEKSVGFNIAGGGHYEFRFDDRWRLRVSAGVYSSTYGDNDYDDLFYFAAGGPKYVWENGEVWTAVKGTRRRYGHKAYNSSAGGLIQAGYDISRRVFAAVSAEFAAVSYDQYGSVLNGSVHSGGIKTFIGLNSASYLVLRAAGEREKTKKRMYANRKWTAGIGAGAELPLGFSVYIEPSVQWVRYDRQAWFVRRLGFEQIREKDRITRWAFRFSNKNMSLFGVVPEFTLAYTDKRSNVWQKEYRKMTLELNFVQNF